MGRLLCAQTCQSPTSTLQGKQVHKDKPDPVAREKSPLANHKTLLFQAIAKQWGQRKGWGWGGGHLLATSTPGTFHSGRREGTPHAVL